MRNKDKSKTLSPHPTPSSQAQLHCQLLYLLSPHTCKGMGNGGCCQSKIVPLCCSSLHTLFPCSSMVFSHEIKSFANCSNMGPLHRVQSFRNRLLQCGSPMGRSSCQEPTPAWAFHRLQQLPSGYLHLPQCGVLHRLQVDICSTIVLPGPPGDNLLHHGRLYRLQGNLCSSVWRTSSLPLLHRPWCLQGCFSHFLFSFPSLPSCHFCPFLTTSSPSYHRLG